MRITIRQKNIKITPALSRYIEEKVLKPIRRLLKNDSSRDVVILDLEFGRTTLHHRKGRVYRAEANLSMGKKMLRAEAEEDDIRVACDLLEKELEGLIRTFKGRKLSLAKREGRAAKRVARFHPAARLNRKGRIRNEGN